MAHTLGLCPDCTLPRVNSNRRDIPRLPSFQGLHSRVLFSQHSSVDALPSLRAFNAFSSRCARRIYQESLYMVYRTRCIGKSANSTVSTLWLWFVRDLAKITVIATSVTAYRRRRSSPSSRASPLIRVRDLALAVAKLRCFIQCETTQIQVWSSRLTCRELSCSDA